MVLIPSRNKTRGFVPKRNYDPTIEIPITKESAWDQKSLYFLHFFSTPSFLVPPLFS
jgi:hypothetical protein